MLGLVSCRKAELTTGLAVDNDDVYVSRNEGSTRIMVYGATEFDVTVQQGIDWLSVGQKQSGTDRGSFILNFTANPSIAREANVYLTAGSQSKTIRIMQNANSKSPGMYIPKSELSLPAGHYQINVPVTLTNIDAVFDKIKVTASEEWLSVMNMDPEAKTVGVDIAANESGAEREAQATFLLTDAKGQNIIDCTLKVKQGGEKEYIRLDTDNLEVSASAYTATVGIETNLADMADSVAFKCEYLQGGEGWINASIAGDKLNIRVDANVLPELRKAGVTLSSVDADNHETLSEQVLEILQGFFWEMDMAQVRETVGTQDYTFEPGINSYALKAVVVSDGASPNNAFNPNSNFQTVDTKASRRAVYLQSLDAKFGMRLSFTSEVDTLMRGDLVTIGLSGKTVKVNSDPLFYYMEGLTDDDVVSHETASAPAAVNVKTIGELTDADIFTNVQLKDVEFVFKKGAYTNVQEAYAQNSALNENVKNRAHLGDSPVRLLQDGKGDNIYMAVNTLCQWRRALSPAENPVAGVPQGVGDVCGVLVYELNPRYGHSGAGEVTGNVGKYVIRPLFEQDIKISRESASARRVIAQWVFDHKVTWHHMYDPDYVYNKGSVGNPVPYKWNPQYVMGSITSGTSVFKTNPQNRMVATSGSDAEALFYCDNMTGLVDKVNTTYNTSSTADGHIYSQLAYFRPIMVDGFNSEYVWEGDDLSIAGQWRYTLDDLKPWWTGSQAHYAGRSAYSSYLWPCNLSGWYDWADGGREATGFVVKTSTAGATGKLVLSFDVAAGGRGAINWAQYITNVDNSFNNALGYYAQNYPLYWKVQYSVDGGASWNDGAVDAVTDLGEFMMHACAFWSGDAYVDPTSNVKSGTLYCNNQTSLGSCEYSFVLPEAAKGHSEVLIRITPASRIVATGTLGTDMYNKNVNAGVMATAQASFGNMIRFSGVTLQCE